MALIDLYRRTGADLPWGDPLRAHPGVRMEGYFWRFSAPRGDGRVLVALCGVNRADDGHWSTLALAAHPSGFLRAVEHGEGRALPDSLGAQAGRAFDGGLDRLRVNLGEDAELDVRVAAPLPWGRRMFGGSSFFQSVPALNQYWHPWLLGGSARGIARVGEESWQLDGWQVYAEKNWGRGGFPDSWWWGQAHGFAEREACVAFAGGEIKSGPLHTEVTAVVVRLPGGRLLRLGNPGASPVEAEVSDESWSLRGHSPRWRVEIEGRAPRGASHLLPVPLPRERRNVAGALEHLGATISVVVRSRGRGIIWRGDSRVAALEHGGLERAAREAERRGFPGASAVPPVSAPPATESGRSHPTPGTITRTTRRLPRLLRSDLPRNIARQGHHDPHRLVPEIGGRLEHARAATVDHGDTLLATVVGSRLRDAPGARAAVHPDVVDAELGALAHRPVGGLGSGCDHHRIDPSGDRTQVVIGAIALDLVRVRVDGEDLVTPLSKALVDDVAAVVLRLSGDARDGHPLVGQELRCGLFDLLHYPLLVGTALPKPRWAARKA